MIALKTDDITHDFAKVARIILDGERVLITRPRDENFVLVTEKEFNELDRLRQNMAHAAKLTELTNPSRSVLLDAPKLKSDGHEVDRFMMRKHLEKELDYGG